MCFYFDGETPEVYDSKVCKAYKSRKCDACAKIIMPGDLYLRIKYLYEGYLDLVEYCGSCHHTRSMIHEEEIEKGCDWNESWCPYEDIDSVVRSGEYKTKRSSHTEGQTYLASLAVIAAVPESE